GSYAAPQVLTPSRSATHLPFGLLPPLVTLNKDVNAVGGFTAKEDVIRTLYTSDSLEDVAKDLAKDFIARIVEAKPKHDGASEDVASDEAAKFLGTELVNHFRVAAQECRSGALLNLGAPEDITTILTEAQQRLQEVYWMTNSPTPTQVSPGQNVDALQVELLPALLQPGIIVDDHMPR
ncbi:unnamed protein product, partial [Amoebophrya sp. A25]